MEIWKSTQEAKARLRPLQAQGIHVGLVPTMGALHAGHLSLVAEAKRRAEVVVASIFVNPMQFGPNEDFQRYPRDLEGDAKKLESAGCDAIYAPEVSDVYPEGFQTAVEVSGVTQGLCGAVRPGHFRGVTTVVLKLFNVVAPKVAVFGEKDFQQLTVLRTMARDLALDVEIVGAPLMRESDGLAMSSRNAYLSPVDRSQALSLSRGLAAAAERYAGGEREASVLLATARSALDQAGLVPEYLELRSFVDLRPLDRADVPAVMLVAARVGKTRLIDNWILARP
ncbi:MAG: pantoate--beta-alanine ligase [Myxococcota bacterium]